MHWSNVIKKPIISEKSAELIEKQGCYTFKIDSKASKKQVKKAIEQLFDVKVAAIKTAKIAGKSRRQRGKRKKVASSPTKKAFVTLREGKIEGWFD